ncbi:MAG: hypothetical protein WAL59_27910 [Roseiarcus sp.]
MITIFKSSLFLAALALVLAGSTAAAFAQSAETPYVNGPGCESKQPCPGPANSASAAAKSVRHARAAGAFALASELQLFRQPTMISFLTQLKLDEISSVGKAANPDARILLMKRDGAALSPEDALRASIASGLADDDIADKAAWIAEQTKAYNEHIAKSIVTIRKGATEMSVSDETIIAIAKNVVERGAPAVFAKSAYITAIATRADAIRKAGESTQQAFARAITEDDVGRLLYKASKAATGPEVEPAEVEPPKQPSYMGQPGHARMQVLADDYKNANPRLSPAGAYAHVYSHPDNTALREQCKAEHFAAISKAAAA